MSLIVFVLGLFCWNCRHYGHSRSGCPQPPCRRRPGTLRDAERGAGFQAFLHAAVTVRKDIRETREKEDRRMAENRQLEDVRISNDRRREDEVRDARRLTEDRTREDQRGREDRQTSEGEDKNRPSFRHLYQGAFRR